MKNEMEKLHYESTMYLKKNADAITNTNNA